jgi:selenocysteine lyase/cysteine desulfurase
MRSGAPAQPISALVSVELPKETSSRVLMEALTAKHAIQVKSFLQPFNGIRLSPHVFNTESDIDRTLQAIEQELG